MIQGTKVPATLLPLPWPVTLISREDPRSTIHKLPRHPFRNTNRNPTFPSYKQTAIHEPSAVIVLFLGQRPSLLSLYGQCTATSHNTLSVTGVRRGNLPRTPRHREGSRRRRGQTKRPRQLLPALTGWPRRIALSETEIQHLRCRTAAAHRMQLLNPTQSSEARVKIRRV